MIAKYTAALLATLSAPVFAGPVYRLVDELDQVAYQKAQQRDDTATRTLSNINIKTSKGKCLFVDELSGDASANLSPIQVAGCGATDGQGFDVITQGKHNDAANSFLIVSTLTQACFTFDPTQATGQQVMLFSCGGVADGSGNVTTSQLFPGDGSAGALTLAPENQAASCLTVKGNSVEIADCEDGNEAQTFIFDDGTVSENDNEKVDDAPTTASSAKADATAPGEQLITVTCQAVTVTEAAVTVTATESVTVTVTEASTSPDATTDTTSTTTLFITVDPLSSTNLAESFSSTTTIFVTIPFVEVITPSSAAATSASAAPSSKVPSDPNTIPQISINPSTTVRVTGATTAPTVSSSAAAVATSAPSSKVPSDPNTIPQISINPSTTVVVQ